MPRAAREREILDAAVEVFGAEGYAHASVAQIARGADVSKPLIYDYFGSKDALFIACVERAGTNLVEHVEAAQGGTTLNQALVTLEAIFTALEPRRADWRVLWDATLPRPSDALDHALKFRRELRQLATQGTHDVLSAGALTDPRAVDLASRLWTSSVMTTVAWWLDHPEISAEEMVNVSRGLLLTLVTPAGTAGQAGRDGRAPGRERAPRAR